MSTVPVRHRSPLSCLLVGLFLSLLPQEPIRAQSPRGSVTAASVQGAVTPSGSLFSYAYTVSNGAASTAGIWRIWLDLTAARNGISLSEIGLTNGECFLEPVAAAVRANPRAQPMIPVALVGPVAWQCGLALSGTAQWFAPDSALQISPGQSVGGFTVTSPGLPGLRAVAVEPLLDVQALDVKLPEDDSPGEIQAYIARVTSIRTAASFHATTVGPTAPPANFIPENFLQTVISYKEQAIKQGWIKDQGIGISLDAKLNAAQAALARGDNNTAANVLNALLNEVAAQAGKQLSSEAVALLKFNTQYLISKIQ
jgi:hypothetical protein